MNPMPYDVPLPLEGLALTPAQQGEVLTDEAVALVDAHAQPQWKQAAYEAVETLASRQVDLTTDDVWHFLRLHGLADGTHEKRAMGAVMRRAQSAGIIKATDNFRRSERPECHRNPKQVWASLLHSGPVVRLASA